MINSRLSLSSGLESFWVCKMFAIYPKSRIKCIAFLYFQSFSDIVLFYFFIKYISQLPKCHNFKNWFCMTQNKTVSVGLMKQKFVFCSGNNSGVKQWLFWFNSSRILRLDTKVKTLWPRGEYRYIDQRENRCVWQKTSCELNRFLWKTLLDPYLMTSSYILLAMLHDQPQPEGNLETFSVRDFAPLTKI